MQIKNVSRFGDLEVPLLGRVVAHGEVVDVTAEQAEQLLLQADNWQADNWQAIPAEITGKGD